MRPLGPSEIRVPSIFTAGAFGTNVVPPVMTAPFAPIVMVSPAAVSTCAAVMAGIPIIELAVIRPSKSWDMGVPETVIPCRILNVWPSIAAPFDDIVRVLPAVVIFLPDAADALGMRPGRVDVPSIW